MNHSDHEKMCEDAAFGEWLIMTIAESIGMEADVAQIKKAIYKGTSCGAWVEFDEHGIQVGTIVEGSDATYSERIQMTDDPELLCKRFWDAIHRCEDFSDENFNEDDLFS